MNAAPITIGVGVGLVLLYMAYRAARPRMIASIGDYVEAHLVESLDGASLAALEIVGASRVAGMVGRAVSTALDKELP